jgi:L-ascorbate metabolism protein UlaG (beta-lactamase superfamily)
MKNLLFTAIMLIALFLGTHAFAQESGGNNGTVQTLKPLENQACPKLLKGMVHLTDNDIRFRTKKGIVVFVDPLVSPSKESVLKSGMIKPDLILITHSHNDHFSISKIREYLKLNPNVQIAGPEDVAQKLVEKGISVTEVKPGESYNLAGISFRTVPAYFQNKDYGHPKENGWVGYLLKMDGANYYVTGDTEPLPEMKGLKVDVLLPLLWGCGGNLDQALKMAELTQPRMVVPVHHSQQLPSIEKYAAQLPAKVSYYYYLNGELYSGR